MKAQYGGETEDGNELIPIQIDEYSPIEFISKNEAIKIVADQLEHQQQIFLTSPDEEKQEILANLALEFANNNASVLDQEVVQCTINRVIFNLLRTFYIPESVAKTVASWTAWFIRGAWDISFTFVKTTVYYMLSNWQIFLILFSVVFIQLAALTSFEVIGNKLLNFLQEGEVKKGDLLTLANPWIAWIIGVNSGPIILPLVEIVNIGSTIGFAWGSGKLIINYLVELKNNLGEINANCLTNSLSSESRNQLEKQVEEAFQSINRSPAVKKGIKQSRSLKNKSAKQVEEIENEFVNHVQNAITNTPIHEITTLIDAPNPGQITPDQYIQSIVQFSVNLAESIKPQPKLDGIEHVDPFSIQLSPFAPNDQIDQDTNAEYISKQLTDQFSIVLASPL